MLSLNSQIGCAPNSFSYAINNKQFFFFGGGGRGCVCVGGGRVVSMIAWSKNYLLKIYTFKLNAFMDINLTINIHLQMFLRQLKICMQSCVSKCLTSSICDLCCVYSC